LLNMEQMMARAKAVVALIGLAIAAAPSFAVYAMTRAFCGSRSRGSCRQPRRSLRGLEPTQCRSRATTNLPELARSFNSMVVDLRRYPRRGGGYSRTLEEKVRERTADLEEMNKTLRDTQAQLIQASKMAAMGQFGAGVAHELNQPLAGIPDTTDLLLLKLDKDGSEYRYAKKIEDQCARMTKIVSNLRTFARQS